jgi:hypothetical protein
MVVAEKILGPPNFHGDEIRHCCSLRRAARWLFQNLTFPDKLKYPPRRLQAVLVGNATVVSHITLTAPSA